MTEFIMGVVSSLFASLLIFVFRFNLGFLVNFLFSAVYPDLTGSYRYHAYETIYLDKKPKKNEKSLVTPVNVRVSNRTLLKYLKKRKNSEKFFIEIKQFANRVSGRIYCVKNGITENHEKISGKISASRVLVMNSETTDNSHHNIGTYLLNLSNDQKTLRGTRSNLCMECGDATSSNILLEKV